MGVVLVVVFPRLFYSPHPAIRRKTGEKGGPKKKKPPPPAIIHDCLMSVSFIARLPFCACSHHRSARLFRKENFGSRCETVTWPQAVESKEICAVMAGRSARRTQLADRAQCAIQRERQVSPESNSRPLKQWRCRHASRRESPD